MIVLIAVSCGNGKEEVPEGVIPQEKMVEVLTEIELTQALIKLKFSKQDSTINQQLLFEEVYTDFSISKEQFNISLVYYCEHPKALEEMYVEVINNLSVKQTEFQNN